MPGPIVKILSPHTYNLYQSLTDLTGDIGWISISIFSHATTLELLRFCFYILFYFTAVQLLSERIYLKKTIAIITGFAALLSLIAIIEFMLATTLSALWFELMDYSTSFAKSLVRKSLISLI